MGTETQGKIIIRRGEARDAKAIYRIGTLCFTDAWREETVAHDLAQPLSRYWVAEVNHQVAAFACFWFIVDELQLIYIRNTGWKLLLFERALMSILLKMDIL